MTFDMMGYVVVMALDMMGYVIRYVRPVIQTLTITLPIHYCISSTTYAITNYNVNNKQQKLQNN